LRNKEFTILGDSKDVTLKNLAWPDHATTSFRRRKLSLVSENQRQQSHYPWFLRISATTASGDNP
jgi:hypothetical protein